MFMQYTARKALKYIFLAKFVIFKLLLFSSFRIVSQIKIHQLAKLNKMNRFSYLLPVWAMMLDLLLSYALCERKLQRL